MFMRRRALFGFVSSLVLFATAVVAVGQQSPKKLYIEQFTSRDKVDPIALSSFRDLFEESFVNAFRDTGQYTVLNRQELEKILSSSKGEIMATSMAQVDPDTIARLKIAKAEGVVFGRVIDDEDSGEVVISAKLQSFDSAILWNKSVTMKRGLMHDEASRKAAMAELVRSVIAAAMGQVGSRIAKLQGDVSLQMTGGASLDTGIVVTSNGASGTYTARFEKTAGTQGPVFTGGVLSDDGKLLVFKSATAGIMYALDGKVFVTQSGEMTLNLKRVPDPADESTQSGDLSGTWSLNNEQKFGGNGKPVAMAGQIAGTYKATMGMKN